MDMYKKRSLLDWTILLGLALLLSVRSADAITPLSAEYAGSSKCQPCHERIYEQWSRTPHRAVMRRATAQSLLGDFRAPEPLEAKGRNTRMFTRDGLFLVETTGCDGRLHSYRVEYVLGSLRKERYLTRFPNGAYHVLPNEWDVKGKRWIYQSGQSTSLPRNEGSWCAPSQAWNIQCAGCHVTGLEVNRNPADNSFKTAWVELGVGCEMCHGPGSHHVISQKSRDMASPRQMSFRQQTELCGQCHVRGYSRRTPIRYGFPVGYRPGDLLSDYFSPYEIETGENTAFFWGTGQERSHHQQYIGFVASKHYAKKKATCVTCHNPHGSDHPHQLRRSTEDNSLCYQCHVDKWANVTAHTHHKSLEVSAGSRCTNCHMIYTSRTINSYDIATHTFWVPSPSDTIRFKVPNACNTCHADKDPVWALDTMIKWWREK